MRDDYSNDSRSADLASGVADLREDDVLRIVHERLSLGNDPLAIIEDCQRGMREVGERYSRRQYYLSALIMAGDILREVMEIVQPIVEGRFSGDTTARVLLGTVQGDIHDLGKNVFEMLLRCYGFTVYDLGVDVPPATFLEEYRTVKPDIVGLSGLLTASYEPMRVTVNLLRAEASAAGRQTPIIIGGQIDDQVCRYVGADYYITDAMEGVRLCRKLLSGE